MRYRALQLVDELFRLTCSNAVPKANSKRRLLLDLTLKNCQHVLQKSDIVVKSSWEYCVALDLISWQLSHLPLKRWPCGLHTQAFVTKISIQSEAFPFPTFLALAWCLCTLPINPVHKSIQLVYESDFLFLFHCQAGNGSLPGLRGTDIGQKASVLTFSDESFLIHQKWLCFAD